MFILQANSELEMARTEIARLHAERERYEETMKKAFMRGVCALNLEAMSMFREGEEGGRRPPPSAVNSHGGTQSGTCAVCCGSPSKKRKREKEQILGIGAEEQRKLFLSFFFLPVPSLQCTCRCY